MKENKEKRLWGPMKRGPHERGQTDDRPNLIEKPVEKEGRKEKERKEETQVFPATTPASKDTPI